MVAIKAHLAAGFLKSPDPRHQAFLFFGSDSGLISERAANLAKAIAARESPPGEILRMDDLDLEDKPERLALELTMAPMFGGRKIVRATAGRRITAATMKPLLEEGALAGVLIVEGSNLKPDDAMRAMFEKSPVAVAVACYADEAQDLSLLIREVLNATGQTITGEAQQLLQSRLGADRSLSRNEVEKLALYAHGKKLIETDDVDEIVGDATELAIDQILIAAASGDARRAVIECQRSVASGESAQFVISSAQRYFQRLHRVRAALDEDRPFDDAIRQLRPPLFFKQKNIFAAQLRQWTSARLNEALADISAAAKSARLNNSLEVELAERLLISLAKRASKP